MPHFAPKLTTDCTDLRERLEHLVKRYPKVTVHRDAEHLTLRLADLLPLDQVLFRRDLLELLHHAKQTTHTPQNAPSWRLSLTAIDEPLLIPAEPEELHATPSPIAKQVDCG